jgi:chromosome segregation ATPase
MKNTISREVYYLIAAVFMTGFTMTVAAAPPTEGEKEAKRDMRKMQAQLSALQKEKAELATELENVKKQLGQAGAKSEALEKKTGGQKKQFAELTAKLQESDTNLQKMTQQYADTSKALLQLQKEKELVQKEKELAEKQLSGDIRVCEKKNADLYRISTELMGKYQSKGVFTALLQAEPFTQLEKVKVQNLMQEYKDKSDAAKLAASQTAAKPKVRETLATTQTGSQPVASPAASGASVQTKNQPVLAEAQGGDNASQAQANKSK